VAWPVAQFSGGAPRSAKLTLMPTSCAARRSPVTRV